MRRVRFSGSSIALSLAQLMTPKPRKTPHSTTEPLAGIASLKISYSARKRFRCWRLTYFGKFSSRVSIESGHAVKMRSILPPISSSAAVRNFFMRRQLQIAGSSSFEEPSYDVRDVVHLIFCRFRTHRQRQDLSTDRVGVVKVPVAQPEGLVPPNRLRPV